MANDFIRALGRTVPCLLPGSGVLVYAQKNVRYIFSMSGCLCYWLWGFKVLSCFMEM